MTDRDDARSPKPSRPDAPATDKSTEPASWYERFEQVIVLVLGAVIAVIVVAALWQLVRTVGTLLVTRSLEPLQDQEFKTLFGMILTLLIALEFRHSIVRVTLRRDSIVQVKTVVLIALIALARKFVILDVEATPMQILAFAAALLTLGIVYWLLRHREDASERADFREAAQQPHE